MKKLYPLSLILITAIALTGCGASGRAAAPAPDFGYNQPLPNSSVDLYAQKDSPQSAPVSGIAPNDAVTVAGESAPTGNSTGGNAAPVQRLVIQNADVAIVVSDVETRMKNIQVMAEQLGGFVVSSNLYQSYNKSNVQVPEAQVVIRVPAGKLDGALEQIKKDVVEVTSENRSGQDVTADYIDQKSRLANLEAAEAQLNDIMKTAQKTDDVVNIFNQLVYYREQIEVVKGQIKYYEEAAALSSVTVTITEEDKTPPIQIGKWEPTGVAKQAIQDLIYFYQDFVDFVIRFVIYTLPVWITVLVPLYLIFIGLRALFRKVRGNKKPVEPKVDAKVEPKAEEAKQVKKK